MQALGKSRRIGAQGPCQLWPTGFMADQLGRVGPQGQYRGTDRHGLAMAVSDQATVGRNDRVAYAAFVALALEEAVIEHVQLHDPPGNRQATYSQKPYDDRKAPGRKRHVGLELHHGFTRMTSLASGTRMFNWLAARVSTRLCAVQVLCSRIRRPHSAWAFSR